MNEVITEPSKGCPKCGDASFDSPPYREQYDHEYMMVTRLRECRRCNYVEPSRHDSAFNPVTN